MPLADKNAVVNLALDLLGEPYLENYLTDTTVAGQAARLHLDQCVETVLEGHVWSFATRCAGLTTVPVDETTAVLSLGSEAADNGLDFTAVEVGPGGNDISVEVTDPIIAATPLVTVDSGRITISPAAGSVTLETSFSGINNDLLFTWTGTGPIPSIVFAVKADGNPSPAAASWDSTTHVLTVQPGDSGDTRITSASDILSLLAIELTMSGLAAALAPGNSGAGVVGVMALTEMTDYQDISPAADLLEALQGSAAVNALVTVAATGASDGTGELGAVAATNLSGGSSTEHVYAPAYGSAFNLPADCLRVIKLDGTDIDVPQNRFEIQGRYLLLVAVDAAAPVVHYITNAPPVDEWPTTFTDAVAFLLAARLCPKLADDTGKSERLMAGHENALGKARSKDARETRSKENNSPRQLAVRSGLVASRFGGGGCNPLPSPPTDS